MDNVGLNCDLRLEFYTVLLVKYMNIFEIIIKHNKHETSKICK